MTTERMSDDQFAALSIPVLKHGGSYKERALITELARARAAETELRAENAALRALVGDLLRLEKELTGMGCLEHECTQLREAVQAEAARLGVEEE